MVAVPGKGGAALAAPVRRGARYLDPRTSRWISGDPAIGEYIPGAPVNDEVKKQNQNLPGGAGIFNLVNLHVYHYAGNNPVKYTDPDGRLSEDEETANAAKSLGEKGPKPLPANLENILKDNDWTIVKGDERKSANDSVKEKADQDNLDWSVSSSKEDTPLTEEEELSIADEFKNAIDKWSRANNKPVRREPQKPLTKTTIFEGRIFNIRTRDSGTDKTDIIMRQYIDVNGDDNIDGVRVPKR
jgi:hypothetical protein